MDDSPPPEISREEMYDPGYDIEKWNIYTASGYHPTVLGDTFRDGRMTQQLVSLKILRADASVQSREATILQRLQQHSATHPGKQFLPRLVETFSFDGPNGRHLCLVTDPCGCSVRVCKEDSTDFMFPLESSRSLAAQMGLAVSFLHESGIGHGDLFPPNILVRIPRLDSAISTQQLYARFGEPMKYYFTARPNDPPVESQGVVPEYGVYPMNMKMPADRVVDPELILIDYGTSFDVAAIHSESPPIIGTPNVYSPPEKIFHEPITLAADIWTLGVSIYEVLGERILFEVLFDNPNDVVSEMITTLGRPPKRWWEVWSSRGECFDKNADWTENYNMLLRPESRKLKQRLWDMGRGETPDTCVWDIKGGEMDDLEALLRGMLTFEPAERWTIQDVMGSRYMQKWALPAWERQQERTKAAQEKAL